LNGRDWIRDPTELSLEIQASVSSMVAFAFFLGKREIAEMKKQLHSANKIVRNREEAGSLGSESRSHYSAGQGEGFRGSRA
jgi:hypothetical protein